MQMTRLTRGLGVLVLGAAGLGASLALAGPTGANVTGFDPPPPSGSGGFYDSSGPITAAPSGDSVQLVVTVEQPDTNATPDGSIMLTWNPADFTLVGTGSDTSGVCTTGTGTLTCTYTDMAHTFKSVGYDSAGGAPGSQRHDYGDSADGRSSNELHVLAGHQQRSNHEGSVQERRLGDPHRFRRSTLQEPGRLRELCQHGRPQLRFRIARTLIGTRWPIAAA